MPKYSLSTWLFIAMIAIVIIGSSLDTFDMMFGTRISPLGGLVLAAIAAILLVTFVWLAFAARRK